jgi:hypothetical protein
MRRITVIAACALLVAGLGFGGMGLAGAGDGGGHAGWSVDGPGTTGVAKGDDGSRILSYSFDVPGPEPLSTWTMAKEADETGSLDLEWSIDGFHGFFLDWIEIYVFADGPGGTTTQTLVATPHAEGVPGEIDGPFHFDGTATVSVTAGYEFGFIIRGDNHAAAGALRGNLTVKERD